jgi:hypothetical protein
LSITNYASSTGSTSYVAANSAVNSLDDYTYDAFGNVLMGPIPKSGDSECTVS